jgi:UDP-glucose 4-epimerase
MLLDAGWHVIALSRNVEWLTAVKHVNLRVVAWQSGDNLARDVLADADALFHAAAFVPPDQNDSAYARQCLEVNALGTLTLLDASIAMNVKRFVYLSAGNTYAPLNRPACEDDAVMPTTWATFYLSSKIVGEMYALFYGQTRGLPVTSLRASSVYGPGMGENKLIRRFITNLSEGKPIDVHDGGRFTADFVSADDVVRMAVLAVERGADGVYNVGSGETLSTLGLANIIAQIVSAPGELVRVHPPAGGQAGFSALDISKSKALGYSPIKFREGLNDLLVTLD